MQNLNPADGAPGADATRTRGPRARREQPRRARYPDLRPGRPTVPIDEFRLRLDVGGVSYLVRACPRDPGDGTARVLELAAEGQGPGGDAVLCVEWEEPRDDDRHGYRGLSCSCAARPAFTACPHLRALVAFGLLKPRSLADLWGPETDAHVWAVAETVHFQHGGAGR